MIKILGFILCITIIFEGICFSQDISATTEDGRKVILKKDGSWEYRNESKQSISNTSDSYKELKESSNVLKLKGDRFLVWYNPLKWRLNKSVDSEKPSFQHKDGDVYAMVIAERIPMTPEALRDLALKNVENAAPGSRVILEENRLVNGKMIHCMQIEGTIEGVQFIYYGYYYAGKTGVVQLITYTSQNLFSEYKSEMSEFLNGLVINDGVVN